jgi:hypothetical protein
MAKNEDYAVPQHHQQTLRLLLADRAVAQATMQALHGSITEYLTVILAERELDPALWGISKELDQFVLLEFPKPQGQVDPLPAEVAAGPQLVKEA